MWISLYKWSSNDKPSKSFETILIEIDLSFFLRMSSVWSRCNICNIGGRKKGEGENYDPSLICWMIIDKFIFGFFDCCKYSCLTLKIVGRKRKINGWIQSICEIASSKKSFLSIWKIQRNFDRILNGQF